MYFTLYYTKYERQLLVICPHVCHGILRLGIHFTFVRRTRECSEESPNPDISPEVKPLTYVYDIMAIRFIKIGWTQALAQ